MSMSANSEASLGSDAMVGEVVGAADRTEVERNNRIMLYKLLLIVPVMLFFCASMVPLYKQICKVLGITATRAMAENTQIDTSRLIAIDFVANLNTNFAWNFMPVEKHVDVNPGAKMTINYRVTNTLPYATTGRAVPSFAPIEGGLYFNKIECFCFSNQTLQAGETRDMPVTFYVAENIPKDIGAIALSYTFFKVNDSEDAKASSADSMKKTP